MKIKGIKQGKIIKMLEEINIPDGTEILVEIDTDFEQYLSSQCISEKCEFWKALEKFRQEEDLEATGIESEIFTGVRDTSPGRKVVW